MPPARFFVQWAGAAAAVVALVAMSYFLMAGDSRILHNWNSHAPKRKDVTSQWNPILYKLFQGLECKGQVKKLGQEMAKTGTLKVNQTTHQLMLQAFLSSEEIVKRTRECDSYFSTIQPAHELRKNSNVTNTDFVVAFAHLLHHDLGIFEMFLTLYYEPKNLHCVHLDAKAPLIIKRAVHGLVRCYRERYPANPARIFVVEVPATVYWGHSSVLDADLRQKRPL